MNQLRHMRMLIGLCATLMLTLGVLAAPANAASSPKVKGVITLGGKPVAGAKVTLMRGDSDDGENYERYKTVTTSSSGAYTVSYKPSKAWIYNRIVVQDPKHRVVTADRWFKPNIKKTITRNAALKPASTITGKVTRADGGSPTSLRASLGEPDTLGDWGDNTNIYEPNANVGADGTYRLVGLPAGDYEVSFFDTKKQYVTQCYKDVLAELGQSSDCDGAATVTVKTGATTALDDQQLSHRGARIRGTVTDTSGKPIKNVWVTLVEPGASADAQGPDVGTNSAGKYDWRPVVPGKWQLKVVDYRGLWATQWIGGATQKSADTLNLAAGANLTATNFKMKSRARVSTQATARKRKVTLTIKVTRKVTGKAAKGRVTVTVGNVSRIVTLKKGSAKVTLTGLKAGKQTAKAAFRGSSNTAKASKSVTVTVK